MRDKIIPPLNLPPQSPAAIVQESSQGYSARSKRHVQQEPNIKALEKNGLFVTLPEQKHALVLRLDNRSMQQVMDSGGFHPRFNGMPNTGPELHELINSSDQQSARSIPHQLRRQGQAFGDQEVHGGQIWAYHNPGGNNIGVSVATNPLGARNGGTFTSKPKQGDKKSLFVSVLTPGSKYIPITALFQDQDALEDDHKDLDQTKISIRYDSSARAIYSVPLQGEDGAFLKHPNGDIKRIEVLDKNLNGTDKSLTYLVSSEHGSGLEPFRLQYYLDNNDVSTGYFTHQDSGKDQKIVEFGGQRYATCLLFGGQEGRVGALGLKDKDGNIHILDEENSSKLRDELAKNSSSPIISIEEPLQLGEPDLKNSHLGDAVYVERYMESDKIKSLTERDSLENIKQRIIEAEQTNTIEAPLHISFEYELATTHIPLEQVAVSLELEYTGVGDQWEVKKAEKNPYLASELSDIDYAMDANMMKVLALAQTKANYPGQQVILDYRQFEKVSSLDLKVGGLSQLPASRNEALSQGLGDIQDRVQKIQSDVAQEFPQLDGVHQGKLSTHLDKIALAQSIHAQALAQQILTPRTPGTPRRMASSESVVSRQPQVLSGNQGPNQDQDSAQKQKTTRRDARHYVKQALQSGELGHTQPKASGFVDPETLQRTIAQLEKLDPEQSKVFFQERISIGVGSHKMKLGPRTAKISALENEGFQTPITTPRSGRPRGIEDPSKGILSK